MKIGINLDITPIDTVGEVKITIDEGFGLYSMAWLNKEQAIKVIAHLQEQFGI